MSCYNHGEGKEMICLQMSVGNQLTSGPGCLYPLILAFSDCEIGLTSTDREE